MPVGGGSSRRKTLARACPVQAQGASDEERSDEVFPRYPPMGLAEGVATRSGKLDCSKPSHPFEMSLFQRAFLVTDLFEA